MMTLYYILNFTWGIIQTTLGLLVFCLMKILKQPHIVTKFGILCKHNFNSSWFSLGVFVFTPDNPNEDVDINIYTHEVGHSVQSMTSGVFWFFIFGIPSLIWCMFFDKYRQTHNISYYAPYFERTATELGTWFIKRNGGVNE